MINHINGLTFNSLIIHPLLSWGIAITILIGLWGYAELIRVLVFSTAPKKIASISLFFLILMIISQLVFFLATLELASIGILRVFGISLAIMGLIKIAQALNNFSPPVIYAEFKKDPMTNILLSLFLLLCITPVSDADSVAYHLAIPLQILRNQSNHLIGEYWLHGRLIGGGEYFNLLGLAMGSDCLGSLTQWFSLFFFVRLIKDFSIPLWSLMTAPILLFVLYTQKHQLSGDIALTTSAIVFFIFGFEKSYKHIFLLLVPLFYAMSLKYSFYLSGATLWFIFVIYLLIKQYRREFFYTVTASVILYLLILLPIHLFNYVNYGSPVSPFLLSNQKAILSFQQMLKNYQDTGYGFPLGIFVPNSFTAITTILGFSSLIFIFGDCKNLKRKMMLLLGVVLFIVTMLFSQRAARFFLTPLLIMNFSLVYSTQIYFKKLQNYLLRLQGLIVAFCIILTLKLALPGAFTVAGREKCLQNLAYGYNLSQWIDKLTHANDKVIKTTMRPNLFWNKDFIASEIEYFPIEILTSKNDFLLLTLYKIEEGAELIGQENIKISSRNPFNVRYENFFLYLKRGGLL